MDLGIDPLTGLVFLPGAGALVLALLGPVLGDRGVRWSALGISIAAAVAGLVLLERFQPTPGFGLDTPLPLRLEVHHPWIERLGIGYHVGVDGVSVLLIALTTFLTPIVIAGSWRGVQHRILGYHVAMLALETAMLGALVAIDLFLFYIFWEAMLIPMYFLIGIWGGERRIYATLKFFLYTMLGSLLMLVAIAALAVHASRVTGAPTFDLAALLALDLAPDLQRWLFAAFALSFAIKVPVVPFHTWLPDAHVEAPTGGSVILAGILLKMGTYGFLRFALPLFPVAAAESAPLFFVLAGIGIVWGAWMAMVQDDVKKLVAYSSVSHLGYVVLGTFALDLVAAEGALLQMINHGLSTGALFLLVGMLYERRHTRLFEDFGGIARTMPVFAAFFLVVTLSSIGLPGLNGFVGEILVLLGTFRVSPWAAAVAATGMIWGAVYMLTAYQRIFFGTIDREENRSLRDLGPREILLLVLLLVPIVGIGVYPKPLIDRIEPSLDRIVTGVTREYRDSLLDAIPGATSPGKAY